MVAAEPLDQRPHGRHRHAERLRRVDPVARHALAIAGRAAAFEPREDRRGRPVSWGRGAFYRAYRHARDRAMIPSHDRAMSGRCRSPCWALRSPCRRQPPPTLVLSQLSWYSRGGAPLEKLGPVADHGNLEISPDGSKVAVAVVDQSTRTRDLWIYDVKGGARTRFTTDTAEENWMIWSPDGRRVALNSFAPGRSRLLESPVGGRLVDPDAANRRRRRVAGQLVARRQVHPLRHQRPRHEQRHLGAPGRRRHALPVPADARRPRTGPPSRPTASGWPTVPRRRRTCPKYS